MVTKDFNKWRNRVKKTIKPLIVEFFSKDIICKQIQCNLFNINNKRFNALKTKL